MDQIRKIVAWLKRQHFWVLSGLIAVVALVCWYRSSGTLSDELGKNVSTIEAEFKNVAALAGKSFHPNEITKQNQEKQNAEQLQNVQAVWKRLWERQRESVLKWPSQLGPDFLEFIETKQFDDDIPSKFRATYQNYIESHFESLPKSVKARIHSANEMGGGEMMMMRGRGEFEGPMTALDGTEEQTVAADDYLCEWVDQYNVRQQLDFPESPSALRIWVTQENLWVYHALLDVIANTNEASGADRMSNAAVRTIYNLEVGRPAAVASRGRDRIELRQPPMAAGETTDGTMMPSGDLDMEGLRGGGMGQGMMRDRMEGEFGGTQMTPEQERQMLMAGRYLDAEGKPIGLEPGMDPAAAPPEGSSPVEARDPNAPFMRLPIRMALEMDQRWISHLISECASQALQVEITEVRINPPDMASFTGGGGEFGGFGGGVRGGFGGEMNERSMSRLGGGGLGRMEGGGGSLGGPALVPPDRNQLLAFKANPNLVNAEFLGIIYIFNEPNSTGLQQSGELAAINQQPDGETQ